MKTTPVLLVGLDNVAQAIAGKAVRAAFPAASVTAVGSLAEAVQAGAPGGADLVILGVGSESEAGKALALLDEQGLPRWAVAVLGSKADSEAGYAVLPESAATEVMAEILRHELKLQGLRRENARLRGDLHTVASRVNHDLRTPLSPIYTSCEVLRLTLGSLLPTHAPMLLSITNSVDELTTLLDRVGFVLKASVMPKPKASVAMTDIVFGAAGRLESRILAAKATMTQPKSWPDVQGVPAWLETMWLQLIANALQHAGPSPKLELGWDETATDYRFWVRNEGKEIAPEKRAKLFQPFHQLHQTNASRGLGLSIVGRLAELQGGRGGYEPLGADGSRFYFTLPKA
jgi:signal transduction histidine kinase